ncbi:hypothetical protein, partial [Granulicella sp. S156]|uniref:hypothetical protein n=1 Tax=Granulicella sp. S156 TaxID=1747224 RepID=UPI001C2078DA
MQRPARYGSHTPQLSLIGWEQEDRSIRRRVTMASSVSIPLQQGVSVKRHLSSYFPCLPSVTRFGAYPAPCGTARLCFGL